MGILTSQKDLEAKRAAEDDRASSDIFSMSQDSTLPPVFRNMAKKGFDYIIALESEKELLEQRIAELQEGYRQAIEDIEDWADYANYYLTGRDEFDCSIEAHRKTLEGE